MPPVVVLRIDSALLPYYLPTPMCVLCVYMTMDSQRELGDLRAVVLRLRELGWNVDCVLGHSKGEWARTSRPRVGKGVHPGVRILWHGSSSFAYLCTENLEGFSRQVKIGSEFVRGGSDGFSTKIALSAPCCKTLLQKTKRPP